MGAIYYLPTSGTYYDALNDLASNPAFSLTPQAGSTADYYDLPVGSPSHQAHTLTNTASTDIPAGATDILVTVRGYLEIVSGPTAPPTNIRFSYKTGVVTNYFSTYLTLTNPQAATWFTQTDSIFPGSGLAWTIANVAGISMIGVQATVTQKLLRVHAQDLYVSWTDPVSPHKRNGVVIGGYCY